MSTTPRQLFLLADHLKLSLLERQRAVALNLEPNKQDAHIGRSLRDLQQGLSQIEQQAGYTDQPDDSSSDLARLRKQYGELYAQFHGQAPPSADLRRPNDPALADSFAAAQRKAREIGSGKNVRFRDNPDAQELDADDIANRAALFSEQERYRDEPEAPDQSEMDNQQIHAYHSQVLREQDEQLDVLGQSISRTRLLGIQMGDELDEQNELLDDMERGVDRHESTLHRAQKRLGRVARKSRDNWSWVTIGILICILVLLLVLLK
ncbi:snare-domain-containing protein [Teratosphaeria nubilosa]|uniref:Snare-domain-containing protein n=1 Tax=Teratosphaeria nubilosa TaxID=161662 RepID=A0A6G1L2U2_9PEZI|nr:snare-domain-containing protein [Teratosphaeria nubilosa]